MNRAALVGAAKQTDGIVSIPTDHLASGSYLLAISDKSGQPLVRKVIITH
jgi:hypothetical protein